MTDIERVIIDTSVRYLRQKKREYRHRVRYVFEEKKERLFMNKGKEIRGKIKTSI
jgi:hypothetical protein